MTSRKKNSVQNNFQELESQLLRKDKPKNIYYYLKFLFLPLSLIKRFLLNKRSLIILSIYFLLFFVYKRISKHAFFAKYEKSVGYIFKPAQFLISSFSKRNMDSEADKVEAIGVKSMRVVTEEISPTISASGSIDASEKVEIYPKVSGRIEVFYVKEGDSVAKNRRLFKIESLPYELELMKQTAAVESAKSQLNLTKEKYFKARRGIEVRLKELDKITSVFKKTKMELERSRDSFKGKEIIYKEGGFTTEELETARAEMKSKESAFMVAKKDLEIVEVGLRDEDITEAGQNVPREKQSRVKLLKDINTKIEKAELEVAEGMLQSHETQLRTTQILLKETTLFSPIEGVVAKKYKSLGESLTSGTANNQAVLTLVEIDEVYVVFNVNENDSSVLRKGMKVDFTVDVFPDKKFLGKVTLVSPVVDPKAHTVEVKAISKNPNRLLKPGMFARASVVIGKPENIILIPNTAIAPKEEGNALAFIIRAGKTFKADIRTGKKFGEKTEVKEGLKEGDMVAIEKISQLREGMDVLPLIKD